MDRLQSVSTPAGGGETFPDNARREPYPTDVAGGGRDPATGRFAAGNSGRPRGSKNKVTIAREFLESESETLVAHVLASALAGDPVAQRACFTRLLPPRRDMPVEVNLPPIANAADALAASSNVVAMVGEGRLTPVEGARVVGLIAEHLRIVDTADLERRAAARAATRA